MVTVPKPEASGLSTTASIVCGLVIGVAALAVALRFYVRIVTRLGLWYDDWLILAAMCTTITTSVLVVTGNKIDPNGTWVSANSDYTYVYTPQDTLYMKLSYAASLLYFTIAGTSKLGILLMYIRIFFMSNGFRAQVIIASGFVVAYWIACTTATLLTCRPITFIWSSTSGYPQYCFNFNVFWMASGVVELLLDVMILLLPIGAVIKMKLSPRRKTTVVGIFALGGFVTITGIVKTVTAYNPGGHVPLYGATDIWATVHVGMAIVCACLPIMKPLVMRLSGGSFSTRGSTNNSDPDGWNIIHLSVDKRNAEWSRIASPKTPTEAKFHDPHDYDYMKPAIISEPTMDGDLKTFALQVEDGDGLLDASADTVPVAPDVALAPVVTTLWPPTGPYGGFWQTWVFTSTDRDCQYAPQMIFKVGRHGTSEVASWWNSRVPANMNTFAHTAGDLNFAFIGDLSMQMPKGGPVLTFSNIGIAQGHDANGNNWWLGGENCLYTGGNHVTCNGADQNEAAVTASFTRGGKGYVNEVYYDGYAYQ